MDEVYTYERCSLTTVGVVTGATTNMYLLTLFSLSFFYFIGCKYKHFVLRTKIKVTFFFCFFLRTI